MGLLKLWCDERTDEHRFAEMSGVITRLHSATLLQQSQSKAKKMSDVLLLLE